MPMHDWTRVTSGLFHHFHQDWSVEIARTLNRGHMPKGYYALVEQRVDGPEPDIIAVEMKRGKATLPMESATATLSPPRASLSSRITADAVRYAQKANRISIRHPLGEVVAVIEIVSPGNKDSRHSLRSFVEKAIAFLQSGIQLMILDPFPPSDRDPHGIHKAIWDELADEAFELPTGKRLTFVSYQTGDGITAHIEPLAVGDVLPDMPLFLTPREHILVPLEATYAATWAVCPDPVRELVEGLADSNGG